MLRIALAVLCLTIVSGGCFRFRAFETAPAAGTILDPSAVSLEATTPTSVTLKEGDEALLGARVVNASDTSVIWTVEEGRDGGEVSPLGVYSAQTLAPGTYHVIATAAADSDLRLRFDLVVEQTTAPSVRGTVRVAAPIIGRAFLALRCEAADDCGGMFSLSTSIGSSGPYILRGLSNSKACTCSLDAFTTDSPRSLPIAASQRAKVQIALPANHGDVFQALQLVGVAQPEAPAAPPDDHLLVVGDQEVLMIAVGKSTANTRDRDVAYWSRTPSPGPNNKEGSVELYTEDILFLRPPQIEAEATYYVALAGKSGSDISDTLSATRSAKVSKKTTSGSATLRLVLKTQTASGGLLPAYAFVVASDGSVVLRRLEPVESDTRELTLNVPPGTTTVAGVLDFENDGFISAGKGTTASRLVNLVPGNNTATVRLSETDVTPSVGHHRYPSSGRLTAAVRAGTKVPVKASLEPPATSTLPERIDIRLDEVTLDYFGLYADSSSASPFPVAALRKDDSFIVRTFNVDGSASTVLAPLAAVFSDSLVPSLTAAPSGNWVGVVSWVLPPDLLAVCTSVTLLFANAALQPVHDLPCSATSYDFGSVRPSAFGAGTHALVDLTVFDKSVGLITKEIDVTISE